MNRYYLFIFLVLAFSTAAVSSADAAEISNREQKIRTYNEKTIYYQKGYLFSPDKIVQGGREYTVGSRAMFQVLSAYPASASEVENYRFTSMAGGIMLAGGAVVFFGGFLVPRLMSSQDPTLTGVVTLSVLIAGIGLGAGGIWLMNSDIKQNYLYKSIWYYNESVLFEDTPSLSGKKETRFGLFSWAREF